MDGTVYVRPDTDDPARFAAGAMLLVGETKVRVERARRTSNRLFVKFAEISDRTAAERIRGRQIFIEERQRRELGSGEYWPDQLEGLDVRLPSGTSVGRVIGVVWADVQDRLLIETKAGPKEIPFVDELVPSVNPDEGYLVVVDIPGLL